MKPQGKVAEALKELLDFLEVCVHQVLHARAVYPQAIFDRRRKYGLPVYMSRHPDLNLYVREVLDAAAPMLQEGSIDKLVLCVQGPTGEPLESYAFQIPDPLALLHQLADLPPPSSVTASVAVSSSAAAAVNLPRAACDPYPTFRQILLRLAVCDQQAELAPVPEDATFALLLSTRGPNNAAGAARGGGGSSKGQKAPNAWAAAIASGEFTLSSRPQDYYLTGPAQQGQGEGPQPPAPPPVGTMNIVNWAREAGGGASKQPREFMSVWLRSKLLLGAAGAQGQGGGGAFLKEQEEVDDEDEFH